MNINDQSGNSPQRTYNVKDVADILGVSLRTAYNLCEGTKDFKVLKMGKRCIRIHKGSFDMWFNSEFIVPS